MTKPILGFLRLLRQPFPDLVNVIAGLACVIVGLALFVQGLEMGLFSIGEAMAQAMARKGSLAILLAFAFALGFGTTVAGEAGAIVNEVEAQDSYAFWLRMTVALSVGAALVLGVFRILVGWPIQYFIIGGYLLVIIITGFAPPEIVGIVFHAR